MACCTTSNNEVSACTASARLLAPAPWITYTGLDDGIIDCVLEIRGSYKIGKYMPGTLIPVIEESRLFNDPPDYALLLSWHIADELMPKLREKGFKGGFIIPLPEPRVATPSAGGDKSSAGFARGRCGGP